MSYEFFRTDVLSNLSGVLPEDLIPPAINAVDRTAVGYEFSPRNVSLIVVDGIPEPLRIYIATRATEKLSKETLRNYFYTLRTFFLYVAKDLDRITANDIRCFLFDYQRRTGISDRTLDSKLGQINTFFDWCVKEDILVTNPCAKVLRIKYYAEPRNPLDPVELEMMRQSCTCRREKAIVDLLFSTGLRVSELCALKFEDIDLHERSVRVMHGKGNKYRMTYMNAEAVVSLRMYMAERIDNCPFVIVNKRGQEKHRLTKKAIEEEIKRICQRAEINSKKAHPHNLRHTFATVMIRNGAPVQHVQKLLGHTKLETTMIYAKDNQDDIKRTHERCAV